MSDVEDACGPESVGKVPLRIAAIFVILVRLDLSHRLARPTARSDFLAALAAQVTSLVGTMFPIMSKRVGVLRRIVPGGVFDFAKCARLSLSSLPLHLALAPC